MDPIPYRRSFSATEYAAIGRGFVPHEMEDKWFIFCEDDVLYLHRSWTGHGVYRVAFRPLDDAWQVHEAYVSADQNKYRRGSADYEVLLVDFLIRALLLHEVVPFPFPAALHRSSHYRFLVVGNVLTADTAAPECVLVRVYWTLKRWFLRGT